MSTEKLIQAIELIKSGNKTDAIPLLNDYLLINPDEEHAWSWLFMCLDN